MIRSTRPAVSSAPSLAPGSVYLLVAVTSPSLRQRMPAGVLALAIELPSAPMPPARSGVVDLPASAVREVA